METPKYHFKQAELYTIARLVVAAVNFFLTRFTAFKGKYNAAWVTAQNLAIDAAEDLPDEEQRDELHQTRHVELEEMVKEATNKFNALKRYIVEVFNEDLWEIKIDAAGGAHYAAAANNDFDAVEQMLKDGNKFINDNLTQLLDGGNNMPATFQTDFNTLKTNFKTLHIDYLGSEAGAELGTEEKIEANNALYKTITSVNADAQVIFTGADEESLRSQFTLESQLELVRGAGVAGMRFHVTDALTGEDIEGVTVGLKEGVHVTTDENGRAIKLQLAAGSYAVAAAKTGYNTYHTNVIVVTGTVKRVNIQLQQV